MSRIKDGAVEVKVWAGVCAGKQAGRPVGKGWLSILRRTEKWRRWWVLFHEVQGRSTGTCPMYTTLPAMISLALACDRCDQATLQATPFGFTHCVLFRAAWHIAQCSWHNAQCRIAWHSIAWHSIAWHSRAAVQSQRQAVHR